MEHIVMRPFREAGRDLKPGDRVDATLWPNTVLLEAQRFLRPAPESAGQGSEGKGGRDERRGGARGAA